MISIVKENLEALKSQDIWSIVLFILYKLKDTQEYSPISELAYILDKDNMLKLCEYFGGVTLKIPTISELEDILTALAIYIDVNIHNKPYDLVLKNFNVGINRIRHVKSLYKDVSDILENYTFLSRGQ